MNVEAVETILKAKSHYEILSIIDISSADPSVIKKQYKQIALTVHPDKNSAEKADEAFKLLRAAFECLSDPIKRKEYDKSIVGFNNRKRSWKTETEEERKKRKEEDQQRREEEAEKKREEAEAFCAAAAERMDKARNNWQQWQNKAWSSNSNKKKKTKK